MAPEFYTCNWPYAEHIVDKQHYDHILSFYTTEIDGMEMPSSHHLRNITQNKTTSNQNPSQSNANKKGNWSFCMESLIQKLSNREGDRILFSLYLEEPGRTIELYGKVEFFLETRRNSLFPV